MDQKLFMNKLVYCFDLDGTLCLTEGKNYKKAKPIDMAIQAVNQLYEDGHYIKIFTARGTTSKIDHTILTQSQLYNWKIKYHELITNIKPSFDIMIDDKAINANDWHQSLKKHKTGIVSGAFDIIHPGYIRLFADAKQNCDHLIVALHSDPTIERPYKDKPSQNVSDRKYILSAIKYVDEIIIYETESDLYKILSSGKIDIMILSNEYKNTQFTGYDLELPVYFHDRNHNYSSSKLKRIISEIINV